MKPNLACRVMWFIRLHPAQKFYERMDEDPRLIELNNRFAVKLLCILIPLVISSIFCLYSLGVLFYSIAQSITWAKP